jgi:hypothetical protein
VWADCLDNVRSLTAHNPTGLQGLLRDIFTFTFINRTDVCCCHHVAAILFISETVWLSTVRGEREVYTCSRQRSYQWKTYKESQARGNFHELGPRYHCDSSRRSHWPMWSSHCSDVTKSTEVNKKRVPKDLQRNRKSSFPELLKEWKGKFDTEKTGKASRELNVSWNAAYLQVYHCLKTPRQPNWPIWSSRQCPDVQELSEDQ